jgi:hypothetical protein
MTIFKLIATVLRELSQFFLVGICVYFAHKYDVTHDPMMLAEAGFAALIGIWGKQ